MTNLDPEPTETLAQPAGTCGPRVEFFEAREVPLGGIRGTTVQRTLPQRELPTVGAWCFLDRFGPDEEPMNVLPHPHTGLQTVTWPVTGTIRHRDSLGHDVQVRPGQLNLMTAGRGIAHSEVSDGSEPLSGLQLWAATPGPMPEGADAADFHQVVDLPELTAPGVRITVMVGALGLQERRAESPARVHTELLGADAALDPGARAQVNIDPSHEHAVLVLDGAVTVAGEVVRPGPLAYLGAGRADLDLQAGDDGARLVLIGGEPFEQDLVMFWNFVGRSHDEVAAAREDWENQTARADRAVADGHEWEAPGSELRFGLVPGHGTERIPAPQIPPVRLTPRRRR